MNAPSVKIPSWIKKYSLFIVMGVLLWFKEEVISIFKTGYSETKKQEVKAIVNDSEVIRSIFLNEETQAQINLIKKQGQEELIEKDSKEVKFKVLLSRDMNVSEIYVSPGLGWSYKYTKFLKEKLDSIIDYRVDKAIEEYEKSNIRETHRMRTI